MTEDERFMLGVGLATTGLVVTAAAWRLGSTQNELNRLRRWPIVDIRDQAASARYSRGSLAGRNKRTSLGRNDWSKIDGIVLHQVAVDNVGRAAYPKMTAHLAVHHDGTVYWIHPLNVRLAHGHGFNNDTIGIEVAGHFRNADKMPRAQALGLRRAIQFAKEQGAANGAEIRNLYAHRQSSDDRYCDPGRDIMQRGGMWAARTMGMSVLPGHVRGDGDPLPPDWLKEMPL